MSEQLVDEARSGASTEHVLEPISFDAVWRGLNTKDIEHTKSRLARGGGTTFAAAHEYFLRHRFTRLIDLSNLKKKDEDELHNRGINTRYLIRNLRSTIRRRFYDSRSFQLAAIRRRAMFACCPFSGRIVETRYSFLANLQTVFYRFATDQVFYIVVAGIGAGFEKCALYFPEADLTVTAGRSWSFQLEDLIELKARMVSNAALCSDYLATSKDAISRTAVCLGFYHYAHHLWNELAGLQRLSRAGLLGKVDRYLVMREPLGKLEDFFPRISEQRISRLDDSDALFHRILSDRLFAVKVGGHVIDKELVARANRIALENSLPSTRDMIAAARTECSMLIWIGIRVGSRTWFDQEEGLAKIIKALHERFGSIGVVFDGFSVPGDRPRIAPGVKSEYHNITAEESAVIESVIRKVQDLDKISTFNIVGGSIFDAIVWANAIDFYISSQGTLQHKVGWFGNKPGIVHANRSLIQHVPPRSWTPIKSPVVPKYVRLSNVSDIPANLSEITIYKQIADRREVGAGVQAADMRFLANREFDNYSVDWQGLLADFLGVVGAPQSCREAWSPLASARIWLRDMIRAANTILSSLATTLNVPSWFS
jgi:hypothetical protein